jgi:hypothetical protein
LLSIVPLAVLVLSSQAGHLQAHEGPPFPLFMDRPLGPVKVSLWADPDIGDARFFVVVETPEGQVPAEELRAAVWTEPVSGRLPRTIYPAEKQSLRNRMQFEAQPYFDIQDHWKVGVSLTFAGGGQRELVTEVESTPPGLGPWDLAIYLFPFVLLGGMWAIAIFRRHRNSRSRTIAQPLANRSNSTLPGNEQLGQADQPAAGGAR